MIITVTVIYGAVQVVAQGTLAGPASSATPLADAAAGFGGEALALILTVGATISILGTQQQHDDDGPAFPVRAGTRWLWAEDPGPGASALPYPGRVDPVPGLIAPRPGPVRSFVQLALLSMTTRLFAYIGTAAAVLVLAKRYADRPGALKRPVDR